MDEASPLKEHSTESTVVHSNVRQKIMINNQDEGTLPESPHQKQAVSAKDGFIINAFTNANIYPLVTCMFHTTKVRLKSEVHSCYIER